MAETIYVGRSLVIASANPVKTANVIIGTGSFTSNLTSGSLIVTSPWRAPTLPLYTEAATQPSVASGGDEWFSTSNSNLYQYSSGIWNFLAGLTPPALYSFTNATFTSGSATGRNGPILSQAKTGLDSPGGTPAPSTWYNNTSFFNMTTQGFQLWTVPATGSYTIEVWGARGGNEAGNNYAGGYGARMKGTFTLTASDILKIMIGQSGGTGYGGGGGMTAVATTANVPLIVAGGGNTTSAWSSSVVHATTSTSGVAGSYGGAGSGGNGGSSTAGAWGGAGFYGNPTGSDACSGTAPVSFTNGGVGGSTCNAIGGFGGGSASDGCCQGASGAGGGYSGGSGTSGSSQYGGAGGSYNSGTSPSNDNGGTGTATRSWPNGGQCIITKL